MKYVSVNICGLTEVKNDNKNSKAMQRIESWQKAAAFAARAHQGQFRKDGITPYVAHVFRVTLTVRDLFECNDPETLTAALLHDTIEDTTVDYDDIEEEFSREIADIVAVLSKDTRLREPEREKAYDDGLRHASWKAKIIKLADTYDNFCDQAYALKKPVLLEAAIDRMKRALEIAGDDDPHLSLAISIVKQAVHQAEQAPRA